MLHSNYFKKTMKLTESKSQVARLMASENIFVEQRANAPTAFFDPESRLLVVPELKDDVSVNVMDLMLSHEVGHSLETPPDAWKYAIKELKINKTILNVVEDQRIESFIKQKYPGLKRVYHFGYNELMDIDFFGLSSIDRETLNLVDKINLYFKVGYLEFISFNEIEQSFVDKVSATETFDDVIKVSQELQDYMKEQLKEEYESMQSKEAQQGDFGDSIQVEIEYIDSDYGDDGELNDFSSLKSEELDGEFDYDSLEEYLDDFLKSHTQEASEIRQKDLYKDDGKETIYVDIPNIKLNDYVIDYDTILNKLDKDVKKLSVNHSSYNTFKAENASIISYVIKEFNLKKNAEGRKKAKISKTGDINLNKLYAYKVTEDIFKRSTIVPKAQSHGLVFFLDWSGSMCTIMQDTIKQLLTLLTFCKKTNIPFEVYAFTTNYYDGKEKDTTRPHRELNLTDVDLMNLFSSRMSNNKFITMSNYLLSMYTYRFSADPTAQYEYHCTSPIPTYFQLGNTPLNHAMILSNKVMEEFKERTKVQIANAIYLTDGESHGLQFNDSYTYPYGTETLTRHTNRNVTHGGYNVYLRDKKSKEVLKFKTSYSYNLFNETNQIAKFVRQFSDFKMMAFRLVNSREMKGEYYKLKPSGIPDTKEFKKNNCIEVETNFDKFFFVRSNSLVKDEELGDVEGKTASSIAKDFSKIMSNRVNTRVFLKRFAEFIS